MIKFTNPITIIGLALAGALTFAAFTSSSASAAPLSGAAFSQTGLETTSGEVKKIHGRSFRGGFRGGFRSRGFGFGRGGFRRGFRGGFGRGGFGRGFRGGFRGRGFGGRGFGGRGRGRGGRGGRGR